MKVDRNGKAAVLTGEQLDRLLEAAPMPHHRALWAIQRWTAGRISEALSLQWGAVVGDVVTYKKSSTKTKRTKQVEMSARLRAEVDRYRQEWRKTYGRDPKATDYLFPARCTMREPMTRQGADKVLRETLAKLEIPGASTHTFRRSLATNALRRGCTLKAIQAVTGHKTLAGLGEYLDADKAEIRSVIDD